MLQHKVVFTVLFCVVLAFVSHHASAQQAWTILHSDYNDVTLRDIDAHGDTIVAVGADIATYTSHIFTSLDGGQSWDTTQMSPGPLFRSITFINAEVGIIVSVNTNSCILRTTDGGISWDWGYCDEDSLFTGVNQVEFINNEVGYMAGWGAQSFFSGSLYKTTDAGIHWEHVGGSRAGIPFEFAQWLDEQNAYAGAFLFGSRDLHRTQDGGQTWTTLGGDSLGFANGWFRSVAEGYVVGSGSSGDDGVIYHTVDSGNTWVQQASFPGMFLYSIAFANQNDGVAVGTTSTFPLHSRILQTSDGGATWQQSNGIEVPGALQKVRYFNGRFLAVSDAGHILAYDVYPQAIAEDNVLNRARGLMVYPNPAMDRITIAPATKLSGSCEVSLLDVAGQRVLMTTGRSAGQMWVELDRSRLLPGMYVVELRQQGVLVGTARLVLQ